MPEFRREFLKSKMNKDLDERLIPPGEYRDALNIEISTSESSDAFAVEASNGNTKITASTVFDGYTNPKCIGAARDTENDKIYWFVTSDNKDAILEYDAVSSVVSPVAVAVKATSDVFKFSENFLITGINIIDDLLFFTDDNSEPKKINVNRFKAATNGDFDSHTQIYGGNLLEEHITVIKKYPKAAPNLVIKRTLREGIVDSTFIDTNGDKFVESDNSTTPKAIGSEITLVLTGQPDYKEGDILKVTTTDNATVYTARVSIKSIDDVSSASTTVTVILLSTSDEMLSADNQLWNIELEEGDSFFQDKFPRFAYRWKYNDGEYSAFSPFTGVAFIPDDEEFIYNMEEGHNVNMVNNVRKITLNTFDTLPFDVVEVDVLYKESNAPNIYLVSTLKNKEKSITITSEQIEKTIESNQSLRPYDNVPRKAKAQEITAGRLMYGNYLQNNTFREAVKIKLTNTPTEVDRNTPEPSAKSLRTYQVGVVYLDEFGRQSPVFTSSDSSLRLDGTYADKKNTLKAKINSDAPTWATHYKYYIKENSNEYYNVVMDRFYEGEEDNFWLSFPSSERNKLTEDDYLILKKQNGKNVAFDPDEYGVKSKKYKILDIQPSPPEFIAKKKELIGELSDTSNLFPDTLVGHPREGFRTFRVAGDKIGVDDSELRDLASNDNFFNQNKFIRITDITDVRATNYYQIEKVTKFDNGGGSDFNDADDYYEFTLVKKFGADVNWVGTKDNRVSDLKLQLFSEEIITQNEEFSGRFFVKLKRDDVVAENIFGGPADEFDQVAEAKLKLIDFNDTKAASQTLTAKQNGTNTIYIDDARRSDFAGAGFVIEHDLDLNGNKPTGAEAAGTAAFTVNNAGGKVVFENTIVGPKKGNNRLMLRYIDYGDDRKNSDTTAPKERDFTARDDANNRVTGQSDFQFHEMLRGQKGLYMSFAGDPNNNRIKIRDIKLTAVRNFNSTRRHSSSANRGIRYDIILDSPIVWGPLFSQTGGVDGGNLRVDGLGTGQVFPIRKRLNYATIKLWRKRTNQVQKKTGNPAVWETEPKPSIVDLDLYYEASDAHPIADHGTEQALGSNRNGSKIWYNCFSFGNGVESDRVRDDFNGIRIDKGATASATLDEPFAEERRKTSIIYSGVFNSTSGVNKLNQFIQAEKITKDINDVYGSIQKLHTRDNDLTVLCEDKILKVLANKDAIFEADGDARLVSTNNVLGQAVPYAGDFGISKNPESFADFSYRSYFSDKDRRRVLRLSTDGLTDISGYGMGDYFSDNLALANNIIGTYNEDNNSYNITLNNDTVSFKEAVLGWPSRKSFIPEYGISLNNTYYTFKNGDLYEHTHDANKNTFYGAAQADSTIDIIFNENRNAIKKFKTLNYEGDSGWVADEITTDQETGADVSFKAKENKYFAHMKHVKKHKVTVSIGNSDGGNIIIPDEQSVNILPGATASNTFTFIVKPKSGYKFDSAFTFGSFNTNYLATTGSGNTSASINSDGNMVVSTKLNNFTMTPENVELDLPLVTSGKISTNDFTLAGTFNKTITNSSINDIDGGGTISAIAADGSSWTTSGSSNSSETLLNVLVTPQSNHEFTDDNLPQLVVSGEIQDNYEITGPTAQGTGYTFKVVGSRVNKNLTAENIKIISSPNKAVSLETNAIFAAEISQSAFSKDEEEREIIIRGSVGAQVLLSASVVSSTGTDLAISILDGNGFSTGQKTVTIGSDGQARAIIKVTANSTSGERNVYVLLDETTGYVITDEFDDTDGVDDGQVLYTIKQTLRVGVVPNMTDETTTSPLPSTPVNAAKINIILTNKSLLGDLGFVGNPTTSTTLIKNIANTEDPVENNVFNVLYQLGRDTVTDTTSKIVKVDDLDVANDFLNPDGTNPYDSSTGYLILANGTQLKVIDHNFGTLSNTSGRGGIQVQFEVIKFGSADDTFYLNTANVLELSNNVKTSGSAGTISTTTLTGQGSYIDSDITELSGSTFTDLADNAALEFMYRVTFTDAAHGKYIDNLKVVVDNFGGTGSVDNNTSDTTLVLESGKGDKFGRIKSGDTAIANFKVLANGAISNGSTVTADVTVSDND
jgi:hypothetical protein